MDAQVVHGKYWQEKTLVMADKLKLDIQNTNFDQYFEKKVLDMSQSQKETLPKELLYKVFRNGGGFNGKNSSKLSFLSKIFILWRALKHNWFLVVEGEAGEGASVEEFIALKNAVKKGRNYDTESATDFLKSGTFVTGSKELMDTLGYLNNLSISPAYNFVSRSKNVPKSRVQVWKQHMTYMCKLFSNYEGLKKKMVMEKGLSMSDILVLMAIYDGKEVNGPVLSKGVYKHTYHTSSTQVKRSLGALLMLGLVAKTGNTSSSKFRITALGSNKIDEIMGKYIINP